MATNGPKGKGREGFIKGKVQILNPKTKLYVKQDLDTGKFTEVKETGGKFKGVRTKKGGK